MYSAHVLQPAFQNKIFAAGIKFYELIKLAVKPSIYKDNSSKEYIPYITEAVMKGYTVLDIGSHKRSYFLDLFKISKLPGKLIAFETTSGNYSYLSKMKQLMNLENISIEEFDLSKTNEQVSEIYNAAGATIIDFKARVNIHHKTAKSTDRIDTYCSTNFIIPALIKFKLESNSLDALHGATQILQRYKPQVLLECVEGRVTRDTLLKTFKFLTDLNYSGNFILDTLKVPLASFDFNIYQNEVLGFYCTNFIFE